MREEQRDIKTIDAEGQTLGRLASHIATILIGKDKPVFEPNRDLGDHVQVVNASKIIFSGNKMDQKVYWHHTTHGQGLRMVGLKALWSKDPSDVLRRAVSRMLPKNKHRTERMKRLIVKN
ncbi:50S ribosomal protein L13 [Candidatus Uhrbacteria bacterium]|nr:50S ribosomal protein L13 [Candidatus Uhrbacteria bacterium]